VRACLANPRPFAEKFNSSAAVIGLAFMVMALAHGLSAPVFGWLSDKIGGPVLMLIGLSSLSIALVLLHLSWRLILFNYLFLSRNS
jgi:MFS family permease